MRRRRPHEQRRPDAGNAGTLKIDRAGQADRRENTATVDWNASFFSVWDGRRCLGHIFVGRREFRAYDAADRLLGTFPTRDEARQAVLATRGQP